MRKVAWFQCLSCNLHWLKGSKFFPTCWILIGQSKFPARQPNARWEFDHRHTSGFELSVNKALDKDERITPKLVSFSLTNVHIDIGYNYFLLTRVTTQGIWSIASIAYIRHPKYTKQLLSYSEYIPCLVVKQTLRLNPTAWRTIRAIRTSTDARSKTLSSPAAHSGT